MRHATAGLAALLLLSACSETPEDARADYCEVVEERQVELSDVMAEQSPTTLLTALPIFRDLAAAAPRDIDDDWTVLIDAVAGLDQALDEAGVDPAAYDPAKPPADVTQEQQEAIGRASAELVNPQTDAAFQAVDQQARDVCRTPLYQ